jgi:hypothetical protein
MTRSPWAVLAELAATVVALLAAAASGAVLFALSATGRWQFQNLLLYVGIPAAFVLIVILGLAAVMRWRRLGRGIILGATAGLIGTIGLEAVRIIGFRVFDSMPGDLPTLMGVKATGRIMAGPNTTSTALGYLDHAWNGAVFGVILALLVGGFPARRGTWAGALIGATYGVILGFGFVAGPVPRTLGIGGVFSTVSVAEFQTTVYLAHILFGAITGALIHRFGAQITPLWTPVIDLLRGVTDESADQHATRAKNTSR